MNVTFETGSNTAATTHDWLTPPEIIAALGKFDLDPCASQYQPWRTAAEQFTIQDDGLARNWSGRVWCNPPYGPHAERFLRRMADHGNGVLLIFARTETKAFQEYCWRKANAMLFMAGRIRFRLPGGGVAGPAGAPSVLIAYGKESADSLETSGIDGYFVRLNNIEPSKARQNCLELAA
ncbi:MAG: DNA N-6-adenine-methyltransferase (Dam) [Betaproteobacteria bacterium ADurb.Bin341]|nr:MAG: DNA N-6-adenine-methyltransferase (Dam) [Betaproteobacteria bacterium ADurb.Bin341]